MKGNQKGITRETLTLDVATDMLAHVEQAIQKAGGVYLLSKDHLRVNVGKISTIKRSQPTGCAHSAISFIGRRFVELKSRCDKLMPLFYTSTSEFTSHFKTNYSLMHRHFEFDDNQLVSTNVVSFLLALLDSRISRSELQDLLPVSLTDKLNVARLSLPSVIGVLVLCSLHESGVFGHTDTYNSMMISKELSEASHRFQLKKLAFISKDLDWVDTEESPLIFKDWVQADSYIVNDDMKVALDKESLINAAVTHFKAIDVGFAQKLKCQLKRMRANDSMNAVMLRDLSNALYIVHYYETKYPDKSIPFPVAFTLGAIADIANKKPESSLSLNQRNARAESPKVEVFMPLWDEFNSIDLQLESDIVEMENVLRKLSKPERALLLKMAGAI